MSRNRFDPDQNSLVDRSSSALQDFFRRKSGPLENAVVVKPSACKKVITPVYVPPQRSEPEVSCSADVVEAAACEYSSPASLTTNNSCDQDDLLQQILEAIQQIYELLQAGGKVKVGEPDFNTVVQVTDSSNIVLPANENRIAGFVMNLSGIDLTYNYGDTAVVGDNPVLGPGGTVSLATDSYIYTGRISAVSPIPGDYPVLVIEWEAP